MKLLFSCFILLIVACNNKQPAETGLPKHSMKGYELYSWQENTDWFYSVLPGTNRLKKASEIFDKHKRKTIDELLSTLDGLEKGEYISWSNSKRFTDDRQHPELKYPPPNVKNRILAVCKDKELQIIVEE